MEKVFIGFLPAKVFGLPPLVAFMGDTQLGKKKTLKKPTQRRFLREPDEDIDSAGSWLRRGALLVRT